MFEEVFYKVMTNRRAGKCIERGECQLLNADELDRLKCESGDGTDSVEND